MMKPGDFIRSYGDRYVWFFQDASGPQFLVNEFDVIVFLSDVVQSPMIIRVLTKHGEARGWRTSFHEL